MKLKMVTVNAPNNKKKKNYPFSNFSTDLLDRLLDMISVKMCNNIQTSNMILKNWICMYEAFGQFRGEGILTESAVFIISFHY